MANIRRKVEVEFSRAELPVSDERVKQRMQLMLELDRSEKILWLDIKVRNFRPHRRAFVFEGAALIAAPSGDPDTPKAAA